MTANDTEALINRLMTALETGDVETTKACYAPDVRIWHNFDEVEQTLEQNLKAVYWMAKHVKDRKYTIENRRFWDGGFLQQHVLTGTSESGKAFRMPACIVCTVKDGRITRLEEYLDTGQTAVLRS